MEAVVEPAVAQRTYTAAEYLELEAQAQTRHEFVDGYLIDTAGESKTANEIAGNLYLALRQALKGQPFKVYNHEVKLKINEQRRYRYPDVMVIAATDRAESHMVSEAILVAEITSESTIETDTHSKLLEYSLLPSVQTYLIVDQNEPLVEAYTRRGDAWEYRPFRALTDTIDVPALNVILSLTDLYEGVF
jgi:Uma2 family endonuclease